MCKTTIDYLVKSGWDIFNAPVEFIRFTGNNEADILLNDLQKFPHAFVLACIMDRQMKAERAWLIPYKFQVRLGGFDFERLTKLTISNIYEIMTTPEPLHRFKKIMSENFHQAIELISKRYQGNAANIWLNNPGSGLLVSRFLEFRGVGQKIASMAANILVRHFKIHLAEYVNIDVSVDVHVKRVMVRLGLIPENASVEQVVMAAKTISPEFPGIIDFPCWEIGRKYCRPENPKCTQCDIKSFCKYSN
jgi:endonuclease III